MQAPLDLQGRVAVVTGGASGLGAATARALIDAGATVAVIDRTRVTDGCGHGFEADITDEAQIEAVFRTIAERHGPAFLLVNCAGIADPGSVVRRGVPMPLVEFRRVVEVNLLGMINCIRCAVPQMIEARRDARAEAGVIVNTASIAAFDGQVGQAAYAASKAGVAGMVLPLARELGEHGIRVMGIAPGVFETPMTMNLSPKSREIVFAAVPPFPKRAGTPAEFAALVLAIVSSPMLNGEVIRLDGGLRMPARL